MNKSVVTLYRLPWGSVVDWERREEWYAVRNEGMTYKTSLVGEDAAEEAFHLTNAPEECLSDEHKFLLKSLDFKGPSLSVGDMVRVAPIVYNGVSEYYLCKSQGWEKFHGDIFKMLRYLT